MEIDVSKLGLLKECDKPKEDPIVIIQRTYIGDTCKSKDSILDTVDTGTPIIQKVPDKPQFATPLFKEYFLSEFKTELEKKYARDNLGIYGTDEVDTIINKVIGSNLENYLTKNEILQMISDIKVITHIPVKTINYTIPDRLFI